MSSLDESLRPSSSSSSLLIEFILIGIDGTVMIAIVVVLGIIVVGTVSLLAYYLLANVADCMRAVWGR